MPLISCYLYRMCQFVPLPKEVISKQVKECIYNVMLRHVHGTTVAVEKQCVSVAFGIQHATHLHYTVICGLSASAISFHIISQTA